MLVQNKDEQEENVMSDHALHTGLVTGASSGLGFEVSAQLADAGYERVIVTARTEEKGTATKLRLEQRTGKTVFETVVLDNDSLEVVETASAELVRRGGQIDTLILNAGIAPPSEMLRSKDGLEATVSSSLIGHHLLTMRLLEHNLLAEHARIVIAGSEAARGDVPTFHPLDIGSFAADSFGDDLESAIEAQMYMREPARYKAGDTYATAKMFVSWWAAQLASRLPDGMTVNTVSPGSTPDTNAIENAPAYMRYLMVPIFKLIPGMSHSVADGAARYIEAADYDDDVSGTFFASPPKKMIGPLTEVDLPHINDVDGQQALWNTTVRVAGDVDYPVEIRTAS